MTKRMLIDDTRQEETRVVVLNGNTLEDVEFESETRKQIKGNVYMAKVMRVEPSLQAAFVDYGGNKHGFLAFGEIHPDYYNVSEETLAAIDKEVDEIIENKKQQIREREERREQARLQYEAEEKARREAEERERLEAEAKAAALEAELEKDSENEENVASVEDASSQTEEKSARRTSRRRRKVTRQEPAEAEKADAENENPAIEVVAEAILSDANNEEEAASASEAPEENSKNARPKRKYHRRKKNGNESAAEELKVLPENAVVEEESVSENPNMYDDDDVDDDDDSDNMDYDFEEQRKLLRLRKLYYNSTIQDVIKEGQVLLVQVVKEERGNKGAALTTYLTLAGKYCVLMPNRVKSGGVSRKITNSTDRRRLKDILKSLPISSDMSMIIRTAGEEKTAQDIAKDYNYLIKTWNQIRLAALKTKAPALIHEEGNLIKRALRDMYTKDVSEVLIDGEKAYQTAREFLRIYSPNQLKKIKCSRRDDIPLFQRFQVENQLDKLHDPVVQLESGGYLVINPTEALVSIDVNSGRATKEKDIEETALNTNLEAADEIARQLRMRNLAGLVVVDFIDMEEPANNHAVEKRMKEAMKNDRARVQIAKMSCFGLLEISRQRMHSSFWESNYVTCPHCHGTGIVRTDESAGLFILREIEEEGIKNRFSRLNVSVPTNTAIYLLNQKKKALCDLETKYKMEIVICADDTIANISDYKIERIKITKQQEEEIKPVENEEVFEAEEDEIYVPEEENRKGNRRRHDRRSRFDRKRNWRQRNDAASENAPVTEANDNSAEQPAEEKKRKKGWWSRLIGGE